MTFTKDERLKLQHFFTNLNKNVFVPLNMPEILKGALFSRYSRSVKPLRQLFLEEYLKNEELELNLGNSSAITTGELDKLLNTEKAEKFYSKWLAEYGDDSISELGGVHLGIENVSVLATKSMEDRRIGLSFLEKSTRYVRFDDKVDGKFKYFEDPQILNSRFGGLYTNTIDNLFNTYALLLEPMMDFFKAKYPKPLEVSDKAYESSIRAKACDTLRGLLPLATFTNMGIFGNGRAYEYMLTKMFASNLEEVQGLASNIYTELDKVIHNFIERIKTSKGESYVQYLSDTDKRISVLSRNFTKKIGNTRRTVRLLDYDKDSENKVIACIIFPHSNMPLDKLIKSVGELGKRKRLEILRTYYERRTGRWHKIGRAFEDSYFHFEIISDFGAYKDLERHRVLTQDKQLFTCDLGYDVPSDIKEAGLTKQYTQALDAVEKAYDKMKTKYPAKAQYVVTHAYKVRYRMKMNLREAFHLCELRSSPQGHPNYRYIAQEMFKRISEVFPNFGEAMKFVNMSDPGLERLSAEVRKEEKLKRLV